jgi:hypothetical protein
MTDQSIVWLLSIAVLGTLLLSFLAYRTAAEALRVAQAGGGGNGGGATGGALSRGEREKAKQLAARANALLQKVNAFPPALLGPGADGKVRDSALWTPEEVAQVTDLPPALRGAASDAITAVQEGLTWLLPQIQAIRATPRGSGQHLIDFPHDLWRRSYQGALTGLQELVARSEAAVKQNS